MNFARMRRRAGLGPFGLVAALAALALVSVGCDEDTIPIRDLLANTTSYDGKTVRVAGTVKSAAGAFGYGVYQVDDGTGAITVVTKERGAPVENASVGVEGTFRSAFTIGTDAVAVIEESKRYTP